MPDAQPSAARLSAHRTAYLNLGWKLLIAVVILALMLVGIPVSGAFVFGYIRAILLLWGALLVGIAASNLLEGPRDVRWAWVALVVGAYGAMALPGLAFGADGMVAALGPVVALTLAAHLARRDLQRALRDWALVMGLALYGAVGVQAMRLVIDSFGSRGPVAFLTAVLFPPLVFEALAVVLRRVPALRESRAAYVAALLVSTLLALAAIITVLVSPSTPAFWLVAFAVIAGAFIGGALLVGLLTRPLVEAASGALSPPSAGLSLGRALVELSHGPILISLALYIPLRLLELAQ